MTIEQLNGTKLHAGIIVSCKSNAMKYEPYAAYVVTVDFDQALIGVMKDPESEDEDVRWIRCENCEIVLEAK